MKNWIKMIIAAFVLSATACTNSANDTTITHDSTISVIIDSNAIIPDTNTFFNRRSDSTNLPDEPGPTITSDDTAP